MSTMAVSNTTIFVSTAGRLAITAPKMLEYTTEFAIEPLWSMHSTTSRCGLRALRP